jgi:beta-lactamase regulating signal transducer with metallopeptidase domain/Leucine-rich repeat (LRR) protein
MESWLIRITNYLLTQSWQIAVMTIAVVLVSFLLRNRSAHVRYLLWLIVLAKCLVPPLYPVPVAVLPQQERFAYNIELPRTEGVPEENGVGQTASLPHVTTSPAGYEMRAWLAIGWFAGLVALSFYYLLNALRTQIWLQKKRKELPGQFAVKIESFFISNKIKHIPHIWILERINQPFVWGLVRGSIYLPAKLLEDRHAKFHASLLGHELSHVIRLDAMINSLQVIAQTVFWFHPFVWWANRKIRTEREKCCDEMTIARLNAPPEDYSEAIIETLAAKYEQARPVPSLAVAGQATNIEERINTMLKPGKKFHRRPSPAVLLCFILVTLLAVPSAFVLTARGQTQPTAQSADNEKAEQPSYTARTFNSQFAFDVYQHPFQQRYLMSKRFFWVGHTPSVSPLEIPACYAWGVRPTGPVNDWDLMVREINENKVPDLWLPTTTDSDLMYLRDLTDLRALNVGDERITDTGLKYLKDVRGLQSLKLLSKQITGVGLSYLQDLTALRRLCLWTNKITDADLENFKWPTKLQSLALTGYPITDEGLARISGLTGLQNLEFYNAQITDDGLEHLQRLTELRSLRLTGPQFTDGGLVHLKGLTALQVLYLGWNSQITDAGVAHLRNLRGLLWLDLSGTKITDSGLAHLKDLTALQRLELGWNSQITDAGLSHLKNLSALWRLILAGTQITDIGLTNLTGLSGLQELGLAETRITDTGLTHLKNLLELQQLRLSGTQITDIGLANLAGLNELQMLGLDKTQITDAGLEHLKGLADLTYLNLNGTRVTDAGVQQLQQALPNLYIER